MENKIVRSKFYIVCILMAIHNVDAASLDGSQVKDFYNKRQISNVSERLQETSKPDGKKSRLINLEINDIEVDNTKNSSEDPSKALNGVYTECFLNFSFPCLQKKVLIFLDQLGRVQKFYLVDNFLSVERINKDTTPSLTESTLSARKFQDETVLKTLIDLYVERFFETHVIKLIIPAVLEENGRSTTLDFKIGDNLLNEGRKKGGGGGGGGKMKGMKKMMMMMGMMMIMKMSLLGPMMMGLIGMAALKALIFSIISITISKIMILKKLKMMMDSKGGGHSSGGGHGSGDSGGWSSSSGGGGSGGWDRSLASHRLSYSSYAQ